MSSLPSSNLKHAFVRPPSSYISSRAMRNASSLLLAASMRDKVLYTTTARARSRASAAVHAPVTADLLMLRLPQPLRVAARELGRLPEIPEAARLYAARDFVGALRQAEPAAEVIGAVPMPAMQLAACGTLAQLLRASGRSAHEAAVWADASNKCASIRRSRHLLCGRAGCHLHLGDGLAAIERFNEAARIIDKERQISGFPLIDPGTPLASSLNGHRTLTRILTLGIVDATIPWLRADNNTAQEDASSGDEMAVAAAAGTKMLLGDALAATGDEDLARECWESLGPPGGGSEADAAADAEPSSDAAAAGAAAGGTQAAENARILREIAAALRLGGSSLRSGDVAAARLTLHCRSRPLRGPPSIRPPSTAILSRHAR